MELTLKNQTEILNIHFLKVNIYLILKKKQVI